MVPGAGLAQTSGFRTVVSLSKNLYHIFDFAARSLVFVLIERVECVMEASARWVYAVVDRCFTCRTSVRKKMLISFIIFVKFFAH